MDIKDFDFYKNLLREQSGLYLPPEKAALLQSRLTPIAQKWDFQNIHDMTVSLRGFPKEHLIEDIVQAMVSSETRFFGDSDLFRILETEILPELFEKNKSSKKLNIWVCGCSTGQEVYSLKILLNELAKKDIGSNFQPTIHATDLSEYNLELAENASYSQMDVQNGLSSEILMTYFEQKDKRWLVKKDLKKNILFFPFNLLNPMMDMEIYDLILCRNVITDFAHSIVPDVLSKLSSQLSENGYLALDKDENYDALSYLFERHKDVPGLYKKKKTA